MEKEKVQREQMETAQMRFGMIAPVIQGTYPDASVSAYCSRVAQTMQTLPDGRQVMYKPKTLEKWVSLYKSGGIDALLPKIRCDKGASRVITPEAEREIHRLKREYPRLNGTRIHGKLVEEGFLPGDVSVASVQRYLKRNGLRGVEEAERKDRKAF